MKHPFRPVFYTFGIYMLIKTRLNGLFHKQYVFVNMLLIRVDSPEYA